MPANFTLAKAYVEIGLKGAALKKQLAEAASQAKTAFEKIEKQAKDFGSAASRAFALATATITGLVAAASPVAFETFTGSLQLLSAEIGKQFVPLMVRASAAIQQARFFIRGMDEDTKANIVRWTLYGVALTGIVALLPRLITLLTTLTKVAKGAGVALAFLYSNPVLAGIAALAAALGVVVVKLRSAQEQANEFARLMREKATAEEVANSKEAQTILGDTSLTDAEKREDIETRIAALQAHEREASEEFWARQNSGFFGKAKNFFGGASDAAEKKAAARREIQALEGARRILDGEMKAAPKPGSGLKLSDVPNQSQLVGIEDIGRMALTAGTGTNDLLMEILRTQSEGNTIARETAMNTGRITTGLGR